MNEITIGLIGIGVACSFFLSGLEIGIAMAILGFIGFAYVISVPAALTMVAHDVVDLFCSYGFSVLPLFVLMGQLAFNSGVANRLYDAAYKFVGHIPGGLAMAAVVGCAAFGSVTGSIAATASTFSSIAVPQMDRYNYRRMLTGGVTVCSSTLGVLIPPSVPLIIYGIITEQSIGSG